MDIKLFNFSNFSKCVAFFLFFIIILILLIIPFTFINYKQFLLLIKNLRFIRAIIFGLITSITATIISGIISIPIGYYLSRKKGYFEKVIDTVFEIPLIVPPLIIGAMLLIFFNLTLFNFIFTIQGAIIGQFFVSFPYSLKATKNAFELIPVNYEEIAMTLGATPLRSFFDTTFKLSLNGIITGLILSWIRSFGEFGATLLIGGGIAGKTENIPVFIYMVISEGDFKKGLSASLLIIIFGIFMLIFLKNLVKSKKLG